MIVDHRPAVLLSHIENEERRRRLVLLASAIEGPEAMPDGRAWALAIATIALVVFAFV